MLSPFLQFTDVESSVFVFNDVALSRLDDYGTNIAWHARVQYRLFRGFSSLESLNLLIHTTYSPKVIHGGLARNVLKSMCL